MTSRLSNATLFLMLVLAQAAHSLEEIHFRLWQVFAPAQFVSGLVSADRETGFLILNAAIVLFGLWAYAFRVRPARAGATGLMVFWVMLEALNGSGHMLIALTRGGYFPGVYTAPFLLLFALWLGGRLMSVPANKKPG